jgi:hypothetical protein
MKISSAFRLLFAILLPTATVAFAPSDIHLGKEKQPTVLFAELHEYPMPTWIGKAVTTAAITFSLWAAPSLVVEYTFPMVPSTNPYIAAAVEKASGTGSRVNKDAESLLRLGLPINNKEVRNKSLACN